MRYVSTRGNTREVSFSEALLSGIAPDGGLFVPETFPKFDLQELRGTKYRNVAFSVLAKFADEIPHAVLEDVIRKTYTQELFGSLAITPLQNLEPGLSLLKLSEGPTLAFKDIALQLVGNLMEYELARTGQELTVLGATSGDTGSAAAYALRGKKGIRLFMLSPHGRMSDFQRRQMYTLQDPNVINIAVNGTFDDCQRLVKEIFADTGFSRRYSLGAVNSINIARIIAQIVYYAYAWGHAQHHKNTVKYAVPSGNFGNALSGFYAIKMGLPAEIVVGTNENDVLEEFFVTGMYYPRASKDVVRTTSPSMDIAEASNLERLVYDRVGGAQTKSLWDELRSSGSFQLTDPAFPIPHFGSGKVTQEEVIETIRLVHKKYDVVIDPHTAVAMRVGIEHREGERDHVVVLETAKPAKFADTIKAALGGEPTVPALYASLATMPERFVRIEPDARAVRSIIENA